MENDYRNIPREQLNSNIPQGYTKYTNEIGLTSENKYLKYNTDVVLDFSHKDGVLEGGYVFLQYQTVQKEVNDSIKFNIRLLHSLRVWDNFINK